MATLIKHNIENYDYLQEALLCLIVVFNRKQAGEASKIRVDQNMYGCKVGTVNNADEFGLSMFQRHLMKTHHWSVNASNHGRHVPVILTDFQAGSVAVSSQA